MISIIVPVYNTEKYLDRCIQSILDQTYTNWELLLIDDGSTDSSGTICDKYALQDERIFVFHKKNSGAQSSRDYGVKRSRGEWIAYIDSDDYIAKTYLSKFSQYISDKYEILVSGVTFRGEMPHSIYVKRLLNRTMRSELWGKLFRRKCVENTQSIPTQICIGEDLIANLIYALRSTKNIRCFKEQLYYYTQNPSSLTHTRTPSIEHDEMFLTTVTSIIQPNIFDFYSELNMLRLCVLEDLIVCKVNVSYKKPWINELLQWSKRCSIDFTVRQKIVLRFSNNFVCRYLLAGERRVAKFFEKCK